MSNNFNIRPARPEEAGLVLEFIKKLAVYEKCADEVVADEATLCQSLFEERSAEVVFAEEDGEVVGFALFFHNFSTFLGRAGIYLEDLYILPEYRGRGYGRTLLDCAIAHIREETDAPVTLHVAAWNQTAVQLYRQCGFAVTKVFCPR